MIFNVNAAAVAALALTMAVHAAPSPVAHVLQDIASCDNVNDIRGADFGNHHDDGARGVDRSSLINLSVDHVTHDCDDHSHCTESNHASDRIVDAHIQTTHGDDCDDDGHRRLHPEDHYDDNRRCNDCKSEFWHEGGFLRQIVGEVSEVKRGVLRVEHLPERCSPEEAARKCGPDCNGFVAGWNPLLTYFDLFCLDKAIHAIPTELDVVFSKRKENGWKPQYHYDC